MAVEQYDTDTTTETRSLDAIRRDLADLEGSTLDEVTADLQKARRTVDMQLRGVIESGDAWRALVDEAEPDLDRHERDAIQRLEAMRRRVLSNRDQLRELPYRPNLPADQIAAAETKAASLATRLPGMTAVQMAREIKGATLFGDTAAMAAWAMLAPNIEQRFPSTQRVPDENGRQVIPTQVYRDLLRQCQDATADQQAVETRDKLEEQLRRLNAQVSAIAQARNQHNPTDGVGGVLASYQFGRGGAEQARTERRYDVDAVRARLRST